MGQHHPSKPEAGLYAVKQARDGPLVALAIFYPCPFDPITGEPTERSRPLCALLGGDKWVEPMAFWPYCLNEKITAQRYERLNKRRAWAMRHAPDDPAHTPEKPVDFVRGRTVF